MTDNLTSTRTNRRRGRRLALVVSLAALAILAVSATVLMRSDYGDALSLLFSELPHPPTDSISTTETGLYPLSSTGAEQVADSEYEMLDREWTPPLIDYPGAQDATNPVSAAQQALSYWNRYELTAEPRFADRVVVVADWLIDNQTEQGAWRYDFAFQDLEPGWTSAMAQGEAISVLVRAHHFTGDPHYLEAAQDAFAFMELPVDSGGTVGSMPDGTTMYEEYPASAWAPHVLNGSIFALIGVHDLGVASDSTTIAARFDHMADSLASRLPEYDIGWWSRYALADGHEVASPLYHRLHVRQLEVMALYTGDERWNERAILWREYATDSRLRVLWHKAVGSRL